MNRNRKKVALHGWISKRNSKDLSLIKAENREDLLQEVYRTRGRKDDWDPEDWPPVKVRVTIELGE